ncbi:MAG: DUF3185 family protein [Thioalkalivibrio sp.]|nr:DUF3185 family protein [Thioalkalivibrio sp.]
MTNLVGIVLLIAGIAALIYGYMESQSARDQTARLVLGRFTQKTLALLIGGAVALVLGLILLL